MSSQFRLRVWNGAGEQTVEVPTACVVELRCLEGASGIHLVLSDSQGIRLRSETEAEPGEVVPFQLGVDEQGLPYVFSRDRDTLTLPADVRYHPPHPIPPFAPDGPLDLAVVVDGSLRTWSDTGSSRLLDQKELWPAHVATLVDFVAAVVQDRDARVAVIAFGDVEPPAVTAVDLRPSYQLYPDEEARNLQPFAIDRLRDRLLAIPATSGGDFVDALADALAACLTLRWRDNAYKLVIVSGDSPGASLLHPLPKGADLCVRQRDVDTQAFHLYARGVGMLTIYHAPPPGHPFYGVATRRDLLSAARKQYRELASLPRLAFEAAEFQPQHAADTLAGIDEPVARGTALGEFVRIVRSGETTVASAAATPEKT